MTMKNKKIKNNLFKVGLISLIIINFSLLVFVGWLFFNTYIPKDTPQSFDEIISNCDYSNTERTINCFRDNIFTFFKYNLSNPEIYRLKEENVFYIYDKEDEFRILNIFSTNEQDFYDKMLNYGGECEQWTLFYKILSEKKGYNFIEIETPRHLSGMVVSEDYECLVDQLNVYCKEVK